jgi:hypothetical protein
VNALVIRFLRTSLVATLTIAVWTLMALDRKSNNTQICFQS